MSPQFFYCNHGIQFLKGYILQRKKIFGVNGKDLQKNSFLHRNSGSYAIFVDREIIF